MGDVIFELIAKDNERERQRTESIEAQNRTLREALKVAVKWLPSDIRQDVTSGSVADFVKYTDDYKNDAASMAAGWRLL